MRRLAGSTVALVLVVAGCNSRLLRPPVAVGVDAGDQTVLVTSGNDRIRFPTAMRAFFPSRVALHASDSVKFELRPTGEPHSVALGTLVDDALASVDRLGPGATADALAALPEIARLPRVLAQGDARVNPAAAQRCIAPTAPAEGRVCPRVRQPAFDGSHALYSSGFLAEGESFRVTIAGSIRPGSYGFMCLVHGPAMRGVLQVRRPAVQRPRVVTVKRQSNDEVRALLAQLQPVARDTVQSQGDAITAGAGPAGLVRGILTAFSPRVVKARAGEPVTWRLFGTHSITFNPSRESQKGIFLKERDGTVTVNQDAWRPVGDGAWDGEGVRSSGVIVAEPPASVTWSLTVSRSGRYRYRCLVHAQMQGELLVR